MSCVFLALLALCLLALVGALGVDLVITATSVLANTNATINKDYLLGENCTAGQAVYRDTSTNLLMKAIANNTAAKAAAMGILLNGGSTSQPAQVQTGGTITIGATVAVGTFYVVSNNTGAIAPWADLTTNSYVTLLGVGATTGTITIIGPTATGVLHA